MNNILFLSLFMNYSYNTLHGIFIYVESGSDTGLCSGGANPGAKHPENFPPLELLRGGHFVNG